jgi:hypothetical protein
MVDATSETVWIHGHAGRLQASTGFLCERLSCFLRLKADIAGETWVHYAVPIVLGPEPRVVTQVSIQLRTWGGAEIGSAQLWNGSTRLAAKDADLSSPLGAALHENDDRDPLTIHNIGLSSPVPVSAAVAVSLLVVAHRPRDAVAIAGVSVTTSTAPTAEISRSRAASRTSRSSPL